MASDQISFGSCALKRITDTRRMECVHSDNMSKLAMFRRVGVLHYRQLSSVGIENILGVNDRGLVPSRGKSFSLLNNVQTGSGARSDSYPTGKAA